MAWILGKYWQLSMKATLFLEHLDTAGKVRSTSWVSRTSNANVMNIDFVF